MSPGSIDWLERMTPAELVALVRRLLGEVERFRAENDKLSQAAAGLRVENQALKDEIARLKHLPPRPPRQPSGMEKATDRPEGGAGKPPRRPTGDAKHSRPASAIGATGALIPCISYLPAGAKPARLRTQASPSRLWVWEPACEPGAACVRLSECPNSRKGRSSPHLQGKVMDESRRVTTCVGIDVSKDRLDVHLLPSGQAFAVARDGKGLESLVERLTALEVSLIVLEATGGFGP